MTGTTPNAAARFYVQNSQHIDVGRVADELSLDLALAHRKREPGLSDNAFVAQELKRDPFRMMRLMQRRVGRAKACPTIIDALMAGRMVVAVKTVRDAWSMTLQQSKDVTDAVDAELARLALKPDGGFTNRIADLGAKEAYAEVIAYLKDHRL